MLRVGAIGTNFITDWMCTAISEVEGIEVTAICSRKEETGKAFAEKHGIPKVYTTYIDLAEDPEIEVAYIASPTMYHYDHAKLMLEHGKHVLCEKPVCSNQKEVESLIALAKEKKLVFMEAMKNIHMPGYKAVKEGLEKIGPVRLASIAYCQYSSRYDKFKEGIILNAFNPDLSNGALMDVGSYCFHFMAGLFGRPKNIISNSVKLHNGVDGAGMAIAEYDGFMVHLMYSKVTDTHVLTQIQGEKGCMTVNYCPDVRHVEIKYRGGEVEVMDIDNSKHTMAHEVKDFMKLIEDQNYDHEYLKHSVTEMYVADEIKRQNGIVFPADKREL